MKRAPSASAKRAPKKRPFAPADLDATVQEKRRQLTASDSAATNPVAELQAELSAVDSALAQCRGVDMLLRAKVLKRRQDQLRAALKSSGVDTADQQLHEYLAVLEQLEKKASEKGDGAGKQQLRIVPHTRLLPTRPNQRNILDTLSTRNADKWKALRSFKKRFAVVSGAESDKFALKSRVNPIDVCPNCNVDMVVDRELAIRVCPKCAVTSTFASHIFESKDTEKGESSSRQQSLNHMQKFSMQFERGHPSTPLDVLEAMSVAYSRIHLHDPSKVQACRTSNLLKTVPNMPKTFKRAPDRLTKELKGEGIPEFDTDQISQLLHHRTRLRVTDDLTTAQEEDDGGKKTRKSFSNQIFMRQLGRSLGFEQARLFPNAKTNKIHLERVRALEKECLVPPPGATESGMSAWALFPAS